MRVKNELLISGATPLDDNWTSRGAWLGHVGQYSIQLVFTGDVAGTFSLQVSNDEGNIAAQTLPNQEDGVDNWSTITGSQQIVDEAGTHTWDIEGAGHNWVRVVFESDDSDGSLVSARAYTKGF